MPKPSGYKSMQKFPNASPPTPPASPLLHHSSVCWTLCFLVIFFAVCFFFSPKKSKHPSLAGNNSLISAGSFLLACPVSFMSPAEIFLFGKTKLSKTLMPALVPKTVIMIAEIEQYSQRQAHFEIQWGKVSQHVLCVCAWACVYLSVHMHVVWACEYVLYFSHLEVRVTCCFIIKRHTVSFPSRFIFHVAGLCLLLICMICWHTHPGVFACVLHLCVCVCVCVCAALNVDLTGPWCSCLAQGSGLHTQSQG